MTPLASVWFVLFFTVMISQTAVVHGHGPDWPKAMHSVPLPGANREDALFIAVTPTGDLFFGTDAVSPKQLCARLPQQFARTGERMVYLRVNRRAKSRWVNQAIDCAYAAGVQRIPLITGTVRPSVW